jgi:hypothetical protein
LIFDKKSNFGENLDYTYVDLNGQMTKRVNMTAHFGVRIKGKKK